jgi:hypothetical protein
MKNLIVMVLMVGFAYSAMADCDGDSEWAAIACSSSWHLCGYFIDSNHCTATQESAQSAALENCRNTDCRVVSVDVKHPYDGEPDWAICHAVVSGKNGVFYTDGHEHKYTFHTDAENAALSSCRKHTSNCKLQTQICF